MRSGVSQHVAACDWRLFAGGQNSATHTSREPVDISHAYRSGCRDSSINKCTRVLQSSNRR